MPTFKETFNAARMAGSRMWKETTEAGKEVFAEQAGQWMQGFQILTDSQALRALQIKTLTGGGQFTSVEEKALTLLNWADELKNRVTIVASRVDLDKSTLKAHRRVVNALQQTAPRFGEFVNHTTTGPMEGFAGILRLFEKGQALAATHLRGKMAQRTGIPLLREIPTEVLPFIEGLAIEGLGFAAAISIKGSAQLRRIPGSAIEFTKQKGQRVTQGLDNTENRIFGALDRAENTIYNAADSLELKVRNAWRWILGQEPLQAGLVRTAPVSGSVRPAGAAA